MVINQNFYSGFNIGKVTFHLNNNDTFSYDLFYTGDDGLPKSFLKIYEDNKTVESEKFHWNEIFLIKKRYINILIIL